MNIEQEVFRLASFGTAPIEICWTLNITRREMHEKYHSSLMKGYATHDSAQTLKQKIKASEKMKTYYARHRERILQMNREYRLKNIEKVRAHDIARSKAKTAKKRLLKTQQETAYENN